MRAGYFQFSPVFGDIKANVSRAVDAIASVSADLVVLPELFNTGYQFVSKEEAGSLAEDVPSGYTTKRLSALSIKKQMYIVAGIAEKSGDLLYNSAVITGPQGYMGTYRKTHLFFEEKLWFAPGDTGFKVWPTSVGKIGIMICFDWYFPESCRTLALRGAQVIAHPSNLVLPHCPDAMVTRCLENRVHAVTANRTGLEARGGKGPLTYIGSSQITSFEGKIIQRASRDSDEIFITEIDPENAESKDLNQFNNLFDDRRKDLYE
ncbi:MAG: nitrilase-related carbon-nitrogen hydrolase [Dissulfurispiraceae bacterium]|jgi:predicted amidohydrolase|nr:nitrilase-related carbon-nitrogen hydrolase [Dissulfurispiraceae bacterium]